MKILLLICMFSALTCAAFGQKTYEVQDFSNDYYGKVYIETPSEVFSKGWVAIYEKKTNRQLIKLTVEQLSGGEEAEDGKLKANVKELPYGEQSQIIYDDFNFDGVKDFALMDGQNSCYGGPSFKIYLAGKLKNQFVLNRDFTRLAQDYCGMFDVDHENKKISTMTKSGCCWHEYSEFKVVGNKPVAVKIVEEEVGGLPFHKITTQTWNGKKMVKTTARKFEFESGDFTPVLSFKTADDKTVVLFIYGEEINYAFVNKAGNAEFVYPFDSKSEMKDQTFTLEAKDNHFTLSFVNNGVRYKIDETENEKISVEVNAGGKLTTIAGNQTTQKGSLRELMSAKSTNLILKK